MPKIQRLRVRTVSVPMAHPHRTAGGVVSESPLVLTDVFSDDGVVGHSLVFTYTTAALNPTAELIRNLEELIRGEPLAPVEIEQKLSRRFRLLGTQGLVGIALAAIDMALWDALAQEPRHPRSWNCSAGSRGRSRPMGRSDTTGPRAPPKGAAEWAGRGFRGVKAKIGYPTVQEDVAVIRAIRKAVGDGVAIMVDYNQCLTPAEAVQRLRVLDDEGLTWVEEPTLAHDYAGHALIAREADDPDPVRGELVGHARPAARPRLRGPRTSSCPT